MEINQMQCPECMSEISEGIDTCPQCGFPIEKSNSIIRDKKPFNKRLFLIIIAATLLLAIGIGAICYYFMIWEGEYKITQVKSTVELGMEEDYNSYFTYNKEDIINLSVVDIKNFDINTVGSYEIIYAVTNNRNNTKNMSFPLEVIDTTAPQISLMADEVYIAKGNSFILEEYVEVEEKSDNFSIKSIGDYALDVADTYTIDVYAEDASGNISEKKRFTLIVENRDNCDFRNVKYGDNRETVRRYETEGEFVEESERYLAYNILYDRYDAIVLYTFNLNDELKSIVISIKESHTDYSAYISEYNDIQGKLKQKYGKPKEELVNKGSLYRYCASQGEALMLGQVEMLSRWDLEKEIIFTYLGKDNTIYLMIAYESKEVEDIESLDAF